MKEWLLLVVKGFIIGLGKIMPGVSGGVLAISLGVYERGLGAISCFWSSIRKNLLFLGGLGIGGVCAIILGSDMIQWCLHYYYLPTMLLFIGLMMGGFPSLMKEIKGTNVWNYKLMVLLPVFVLGLMSFFKVPVGVYSEKSFFSFFFFFLIGIVDAITMIIPGISGTAVLMILGCYTTILEVLSNLKSITGLLEGFSILFPFGLGIGIGIIVISKIMNYLFCNYKIKIYYVILSFSMLSTLFLFFQTLQGNYSMISILLGVFCFVVGYCVSIFMERKC